jgi:polysaccharide export outer membrane protein
MRRFAAMMLTVVMVVGGTSGWAQDAVKPGGDGPGDYRMGPEDTIQIAVWRNDALSRTVTIRMDGKISLPLLNDVQASGLTPMELRDELQKRLSEYMTTPEVSVIVLDARSFKVSVIGEVAKPGRYELKTYTTVLDILALSGGPTQFASRNRIYVLRNDGKAQSRIPFNYNKALASPADQDNFYLRAGDIVVVP